MSIRYTPEPLKYLSAQDVKEQLTMEICIRLMRELFVRTSEGNVTHRLRMAMPTEAGKLLGVMPGYLPYKDSVGAKIITVYHDNYKRGLPSHQGIVAVFDGDTGAVRGIVDGMAVTAIRTAAVSAVATDAMAKEDASVLALLGAGVQASTHLEALSLVRKLEKARVWSIDRAEAEAFVLREGPKYPFPIEVCATVEGAVNASDIVCTVTSSKTPILEGRWVRPGTHINAVGACQPKDRELDSDCVAAARLVGDSATSVVNESGDYLFPLQEGRFGEEHLLGELGDVLTGRIAGRLTDEDITLFEALGLAAEDIACAAWLLEK